MERYKVRLAYMCSICCNLIHASCDQPNAQVQAELFNQVSESFLLLLLNVSQKHKDEFFKVD